MVFLCLVLLFATQSFAKDAKKDPDCGDIITIKTSGSGDSSDPDNPSEPDESNISIESFEIKRDNVDEGYQHSIPVDMEGGDTIYIKGKAKIKNKSTEKARDVDVDYRVENERDFDDDDEKVDENRLFNIKADKTKTKKMDPIAITISDNSKEVYIYNKDGKKVETFDIEEGYVKIYFFVDAEEEGREDGDQDISSEFSGDGQYGVVKITVTDFNFDPQGYIDSYDCTSFIGWAKDPDTDDPIYVHVYVEDSNQNKTCIDETLIADTYREDVGYHGFEWIIPEEYKDGNIYKFSFYAINNIEGEHNPLLKKSHSEEEITEFEKICYECSGEKKPVYRLMRETDYAHVLLMDETEISEKLQDEEEDWTLEGVSYCAYDYQAEGTVPNYRLQREQGYFYANNETDRDDAVSIYNFTYEKIDHYINSTQVNGTVTLNRLYHQTREHHFYPLDEELESSYESGFEFEAIHGYVFPPDYEE